MYLFEIVEMQDLSLKRMSYGILVKNLDGGMIIEAAYIPGISCDKAFVMQLMERCERNHLDPVHLLDVVMDAIS